ncbi:MAG: biotin--[acetyl-CoA-carboxylase] ligase [Pseudomonadota bacterium]
MSTKTDWPQGVDRIILDQTDSTMAEARRRADTLAAPTWIMARRQTAARGRRGRPWVEPTGNLAATLVYRPTGTLDQLALRSFVAALALYDALARAVAPDRLSLKWPNDVLLDEAKVAGILLEAIGGPDAPALAVGIGVNLAQAPTPEQVEPGAVAPIGLGAGIGPDDLLCDLAAAYDRHERAICDFGFEQIRKLWLSRAARLGQPMIARTGAETIEGVFETIDAAGHLVLHTPTGARVIPAADVYF